MPEVRDDAEGQTVNARSRVAALFALLLTAGCATTSPRAAVDRTSALVQDRTGQHVTWIASSDDDAAAERAVRGILAQDLTIDGAVQVALLRNRGLQAQYEQLGIAQADLVQAGLLKNPVLAGTFRFPFEAGHIPGIEASLVQSFLDLLTMASRKKIARLGLEGTQYRVASAVVTHVYETKSAYYALQTAQQTYAMRQIVTDAALAAVELARRQHAAETINDLELANEEALYAQVAVDLVKSSAELVAARERLNRAMGTWGDTTDWRVEGKLPPLPSSDPELAGLEAVAIGNRLDLKAAGRDVEVVSYGLALAKNTRWFGGVDAGIDFEQKPEGIHLLGPTVSIEIPIFDQRQAAIAKLEAQLRMARDREAALAIDARSRVRELHGRLVAARTVAESYAKTLVPLRERIVVLSQQQYDAMLVGVFQLLSAKQAEITAYREFLDALRDYWTLRAELELEVGGKLP